MTQGSRQLVRHGGVYAIARVANQGLVFGLLPLYAHLVGKQGVGVLELLATARTVLFLTLGQGLDAAYFRLGFDHRTGEVQRDVEATVVWFAAVSISGAVAICFVIGEPVMAYLMPGVPLLPHGLLTVAAAAALAFVTLQERRLQAQHRPLAYSAFATGRALLTVAGVVVFMMPLDRGVVGKLEADALVFGAVAVVGLLWMRPALPSRFRFDVCRRVIAYGWPLLPSAVAGYALGTIDRLMVNGLLGIGDAGIYSIGYRVASAAGLLALGLSQALSPIFMRTMAQSDDSDQAKAAMARTGLVMVACVAGAGALVTAVAKEALAILMPAEFDEAWAVVAPVTVGFVAWSAYHVFCQPLLYDPRLARRLSLAAVLALGVDVVANLLLIGPFGMLGAAFATLLAFTAMALAALALGQPSARIPYRWSRWLVLAVLTITVSAALWIADTTLDAVGPRLAVKIVALIAAGWVGLRALDTDAASLYRLARRFVQDR